MSKLWSGMLIAIVACVVGLGSAYAGDAPKKKEKKKRKRPSAEQIFKKLDADKDGNLTAAELLKSPRIKDEAKAKEILGKWDADKDGKVTLKEFTAALKKMHSHRHKKGERKKGEHKKGEHKKGEHKK